MTPDEQQRLERIVRRYHGQMDTLELTPDTRAQLAFDLGWLIGLGMRCQQLEAAPAGAQKGAHGERGSA